MAAISGLFFIFLVILTFELADLVSETLWQRYMPEIFKLITAARLRGSLWLVGGRLQGKDARRLKLNHSEVIRLATMEYRYVWQSHPCRRDYCS